MGTLLHNCAERSAWTDQAVMWRGEWGRPRHSCIRWGFTCPKGAVLGILPFVPHWLNGQNDVFFTQKCTRLTHEKLTVFPSDKILLESMFQWLSEDIVRFKIEVGVCKNLQKCNTYFRCRSDRCIFCHSSKASRVPWNKVSHWKVSPGRITWRNKSAGGNFIVVWYPPRSKHVFATM